MDRVTESRMTVTEVEEFLRKPPPGFSVEPLSSGYRVRSNDEESLVLIDGFQSCGRNIVFENSLGRKVKMHNLWEYTSTRKRLLSRRIYLLAVCEEAITVVNEDKKVHFRVLKQYVVSINGSDPLIKWHMEKGLDKTISSVAGESYKVEIDLTEALASWAAKHNKLLNLNPVCSGLTFTLKYYSDALFDFPHWLGFSKRKFKLSLT
ncbi:mesenteric estrogen-dependent adipogenesis protein [Pholidichthys leucotaenia]